MKRIAVIKNKFLSGSGGHDVFRNMAVLALGAGLGKVIALLAIPVLTRLYAPEDFGVLSTFNSVVVLIIPLMTMLYYLAIPLPKSDKIAAHVFLLCLLCISINIFFLAVVLSAFSPVIFAFFNIDVITPYWPYMVIAVAAACTYETLNYWAIRKKNFKIIARTQVGQSITGSLIKIVLGLAAIKPLGLLLGQIFHQGGGISSISISYKNELVKHLKRVRIPLVIFLFRRYSNFPKYKLPSQLLAAFANQAPLLFTTAYFGVSTTGQLGLAIMAVALPVILFQQTTSKAYYAEISRIGKDNKREVFEVTKSVTKRMLLLGLVPSIALFTLGPRLFSIAFGPEWGEAGVFASYLSAYLLMQFMATPAMASLSVLEKQSLEFKINLLRAGYIIAIFYFGQHFSFPVENIILTYSLTLAFHYITITFSVFKLMKS